MRDNKDALGGVTQFDVVERGRKRTKMTRRRQVEEQIGLKKVKKIGSIPRLNYSISTKQICFKVLDTN